MKRIFLKLAALAVAAVALVSGCDCTRIGPDETGYNNVMILYSAGFNNLSGYLREDIEDLRKGYAPDKKSRDVLVVVSHLNSGSSDGTTSIPPVIIDITEGSKGIVFDTIKVYSDETCLSKASDMKEILGDISRMFPSEHYGIVFSSHSTGWLPKGYYSNPDDYDIGPSGGKALSARLRRDVPEGAVPYYEEDYNEFPGMPPVKSLGMTNRKVDGQDYSYEMDIHEFASNIPFHLDYLLFDACLAGGIEVAYELKDLCDVICFSQTEVLAEGYNYETLASNLLEHGSDVVAVADDYFKQYSEKSGDYRSATVSVVDCSKLDGLAETCSTLFRKYNNRISALAPASVQKYGRVYSGVDHHWFYDMEDILVKAGIGSDEAKGLENALNSCILYKNATEAFLPSSGGFKIEHHCGFSMYLPNNGSPYLDTFYKNLKWNKATKLVD